jgi:hypothetical protein
MDERRKYQRGVTDVVATIRAGEQTFTAKMTNISVGGASLRPDSVPPIKKSDELVVVLESDGATLTFKARVTGVYPTVGAPNIGISFMEISAAQYRFISQFLGK